MSHALRSARLWLRRKGPVRLIVGSFLLGAGILALAILAVRQSQESRLTRLTLAYDEHFPVQYVELLRPGENTPVASAFVPTLEPLAVPADRYRLRVSRVGRLSRTFEVLTEPGTETILDPVLAEPMWETQVRPWDPHNWQTPTAVASIPLKKGHDLVVIDGSPEVLTRIDGRTGGVLWQRLLPVPDIKTHGRDLELHTAKADNIPRNIHVTDPMGFTWQAFHPGDLDGDGVADLIWTKRTGSLTFALSSATGRILWESVGLSSRIYLTPEWTGIVRPEVSQDTDAGLLPDIDNDGSPDLFVPFQLHQFQWKPGVAYCGVDVLSGKTGKRLWKSIPAGSDLAPGNFVFVQLARRERRDVLAVTAGDRIDWLTPRDGSQAFPSTKLTARAISAPIIDDPDGDRNDDVVAFTAFGADRMQLSAIASTSGTVAWSVPLDDDGGAYPKLLDLDHDRVPEVLIPPNSQAGRPNVILLDGRNGQVRWKQSVPYSFHALGKSDPVDVIEAPGLDLNRDGIADLLRARGIQSQIGPEPERYQLEVEAISGVDGRTLWLSRFPHSGLQEVQIRTWGQGQDGMPLIAAVTQGATGYQTTLLNASTGLVESVMRSAGAIAIADLDGDEKPELIGTDGRTFSALRQEPPVLWRRLESLTIRDSDVDRDGLKDLVDSDNRLLYSGYYDPVVFKDGVVSPVAPNSDEAGGPVEERVFASANGRRRLTLAADGVAREPDASRALWRSVGPIRDLKAAQLLVHNADWKAPILIESVDEGTVARPMVAANDDPDMVASWDRSGPAPLQYDPRVGFLLPWWMDDYRLKEVGIVVFNGANLAALMGLLPYWLIHFIRARTRSGILRLMALIGVVAVSFAGYRLYEDREWSLTLAIARLPSLPFPVSKLMDRMVEASPRIATILIGLPVVTLFAYASRQLFTRHFRRLASLLALIAAQSLVIGGAWLLLAPLPTGSWRAWDHWWILPLGVSYTAGFATIPVWIVAAALRGFRTAGTAHRNS